MICNKKVYSILLAGGSGVRMNLGQNKVLLPIGGKTCIARSAAAFRLFSDLMILVCRREDLDALTEEISALNLPFPVLPVVGGNTRQESVRRGLDALPEESDAIVLIHDGARCLITSEVIRDALESAVKFGSGVASVPVTDTIKEADRNNFVQRTVPRDLLNIIQTPQAFILGHLRAAHQLALQDGFLGTDDASLMEHAGFRVRLSVGSRTNMKLTTQEDLKMAEALTGRFPNIRVGNGYDVHQLVYDRKLVLCGVEIPYDKGLLGHSDADVALHALMDALLGAAGLGDIGRLFPDHDDRYKGISSLLLLEKVMHLLREHGLEPYNVDVTIIAQKPKLAPYIPRMEENLASALNIPLYRINVKATTTEKLGFEGRLEGISAQAVCLIMEK